MHRVAGADVDVEAGRLVAKHAVEMQVLVILGVGEGRTAALYLSSPYSECSVRTASSV